MSFSFIDSYPNLFQLLAGHFDLDFLQDSDEVAIQKIASSASSKELHLILKEAKAVLNDTVFLWREVEEAANRYFETPKDTREWFVHIIVNPIEQAILQHQD